MGNGSTYTMSIKALFDTSEVASGAKQIQNIFKNIKVSNNLQSEFQKAFSNLEASATKVQQKYEQGFTSKSDVSSFERSFKEAESAALRYQKVIDQIQAEVGTEIDISKILKWDDSTLQRLKEVETRIQQVKASLKFDTNSNALKDIEAALGGITSKGEKTTQWVTQFKQALTSGDLEGAQQALNELDKIWSHFQNNTNLKSNFTAVQDLKKAFEDLQNTGAIHELKELFGKRDQITTEGWDQLVNTIVKVRSGISQVNSQLPSVRNNMSSVASAQQQWNSSLDQFKSRIQYFFGLNNVIQLVRRSIRQAFETVKELDAAMERTAVVTSFDISDMWSQLPKYTQLANELGVTTKGAYETMTLFYQQGLNTNQAFALGTETMKMARIAGLDYATATDYMTAALRGFNMELDALSAQRVNDVYSRLAAITASNTQEISTAMTKVASLAHNANMEFETTSAFLAQIIETTRESAETAGTALKTVVARFSEVKKLYTTDQLTGQDEEGETIDVNRVASALRSAGIDMNKYFLGEVGLDDIFMELASKWETLTSVQQRYIATQAAGSRQQSRFIAMMSNYKRTQQLVEEAYNSNGASAEQFEKTQESLETALNRLSNAWKEFTMNLANNEAIEKVVTALTKVLELVNKITSVFGKGWRSILTGSMTAGALLGGGKIARSALNASKLAGANNMSWFKAFQNQFGQNPYLFDQASGQRLKDEAGNWATRQRGFHLFGQGGFFTMPERIAEPIAPAEVKLSNVDLLKKYGFTQQDYDQIKQGRPEDFNKYGVGGYQRLEELENKKQQLAEYKKQQQQYEQYQQQKAQVRQRQVGGIMAVGGMAFSAAGSAITQNAESIATSLDKSEAAVERFGKGLSTMGTATSLAGSMLAMLPGPIGMVAAAVTMLTGALIAVRGETGAEALKRLSDETNQAEQAATNAANAYEDLLSKTSSHNQLLDNIIGLKEGTIEFRKAILDANTAAQELIDTYGLTSDMYHIDEKSGLITFEPGAMQEVQERQLAGIENSQARARIAKLNEQVQEFTVNHADQAQNIDTQQSLRQYTDSDLERIINAFGDEMEQLYLPDAEKLISSGELNLAAQANGYVANVTETQTQATKRYLQDMQSGTLTGNNAIDNTLINAKATDTYRATLESLTGGARDSLTDLAIEQMTKDFKPNEFNAERASLEEEWGKKKNSAVKEEAEKYLTGAEMSQMTVDQMRTALVQIKTQEALIDKLEEAKKAITLNTDTNEDWVKDYKKQRIKDLQTNFTDSTNSQLIEQSIMRTIGDTQSKLAQYTNLSESLKFGDYTAEQIEDLGKVAQNFGVNFGEKTATVMAEKFNNAIEEGQLDIANKISTMSFSGIASSDLLKLKTEFSDVFSSAFEDLGGEKGLFESLYYGSSDVINALEKAADETKNISGEAILEAAQDCQELADYLEVSETNAAGLAKTLSLINTDQLEVSSLTDTLITAISKGQELNQVLSEADKYISDWKNPPSGDRYASWASGGAKTIKEDWAAGRFQSDATRTWIQEFFGGDFLKKYDDITAKREEKVAKEGLEAGNKYFTEEMGPQIAMIKSLSEGGNLSSLYQYYDQQLSKQERKEAKKQGVSVDKNGYVTFDDNKVKTSADAKKLLTDSLHIPENLANIMLSDYIQNSGDARKKWGHNEAEAGINDFYDTLNKGGNVTRGELESYYEANKEFLDDKSAADFFERFRKGVEKEAANSSGLLLDLPIDWKQQEDPNKLLDKAFGDAGLEGGLKGYLESKGASQTFNRWDEANQSMISTDVLDLNKMVQAYKDLGATEAEALEYSQQYADSISEQSNKQATFTADYDKWVEKKRTLEDGTEESYWEKETGKVEGYTSAIEAAQAAEEAAAKSRSDMESKIQQENFAKGFEGAIQSLTEKGIKLPLSIEAENPEEVQTLKENIEAIEGDHKSTLETTIPGQEDVSQTATNVQIIDDGADSTATVAVSDDTIARLQTVANLLHDIRQGATATATVATGGQVAAKGGKVPAYAKGTVPTLSAGTALTGEEGPELIWNKNKGYAYVTGEKHPEFQNLQPGDRIFNAQETKKILSTAANGGKVAAYAGGYGGGLDIDNPSNSNHHGSGGGGNNSAKDDKWKNEIDWLYNVVQNIEELERQQNFLQEEYEDLLKDSTKTGQDLYNMLIKQLGNLYAQLDTQAYTLARREQEMREFMEITNDKDEYLWYNWEDRTIEIDWDKIDQITNEDEYNHIKELIDQAEDIQDKMDDAEDAIVDINNAIEDLENIWRDTFIDFEDRILKAIVQSYQNIIDNYSELNDTLSDSNNSILEAINKEISLQRQIRDNTKTEEDIADTEAQLAYMRRDTTGGNDLAALQLQKELDDKRQNYEDNLVDQAVNRLQEDNQVAQEQRERQIEIMQAQLDYQSENGEFNEYVRELMESAIGENGELLSNSDLMDILKSTENWAAMSEVSKQVWQEELETDFKQVVAFLLKDANTAQETYFTAVTSAFEGVSDTINKLYHGSYSQPNGSGATSGGYNPFYDSYYYNVVLGNGKTTQGVDSKGRKTGTTSQIRGRANGGIVQQTGWGLLHGTINDPEYVLNARQTEAFLKLADVLPAAMNGVGNTTNATFGATTNNIVINVDKIDSDYSVDQMVARVKESLFESGSYRNNNVLNFLR